MRYEGGAFGAAARACQPRLKNHHAAAVGANDNGVMRMRCFEVFDPEDMTASFSYKREAARLRRGGQGRYHASNRSRCCSSVSGA